MLDSKVVSLRTLEEEDLEARVKWFNDPETNQFLVSDYPMSLSKTRHWFQNSLKDDTKLNLSIVDCKTDKLIGMTGFLNIDQKNAHAQFYITIGEADFRGKGLPNIIIPAVLTHGFTFLRLNKVYLWTLKKNKRAQKVYEKNGFKKEAILRDFLYCRGGFQDIIQHYVLSKEFLAKKIDGEKDVK